MGFLCTAIIHLREPVLGGVLEPALLLVRGVQHVACEPRDAVVTVRFDAAITTVADLVREIEDSGTPVAGVAQRGPRRGAVAGPALPTVRRR